MVAQDEDARLGVSKSSLQRLVQDALDETRREEVRAAETKEEKNALKHTRFTLLKGPWNLTDADAQTLEQLEKSNQSIFRGHMLKEWFGAILDGRQVNVARSRLEEWIDEARESGLKRFARVAGTVERHLDGIVEFVRTRSTNARTEASMARSGPSHGEPSASTPREL